MLRKCCFPFFFLLLLIWTREAFPQNNLSPGEWLHELSLIEQSKAQPTEKKEQLEHLVTLYGKHNSQKDSIYARMVHRLGDYYRSTGDFDKGIALTKSAIDVNRSSNKPYSEESFLVHSYFNLGLYYGMLNIFDEFHLFMDSCIALAKKYPQKSFIATNAFEQKALSYFSTGEYYRSIEIAEHGLLYAKDFMDYEFKALLYLQKAQAQIELNLIEEAENNINTASEIFSTVGSTEEYLSIVYSINALLLKHKKDFKGAISLYQKAYDIDFRNGAVLNCIKNLSNLGLLYDKELNDPQMALESYLNSIKLFKNVEDTYQLALIYNNIGTVHWRQKEYLKALEYFQKGLNKLPIGLTDTLWQSTPSHQQIKLVNNHQIVLNLLTNKGETLLDLYKQEQSDDYLICALQTFKIADKAIDQMRWNQNTVQSKLFWREKSKKIYEQAIEVCYLLQDAESGFYFFEKSRAVLLNDKLNELGAKKFLSSTDQNKEKSLRIQLLSIQQKLAWLGESDEEFRLTSLSRYNIQESYEKFITNLESKYPVYYQYKYDTAINTIEELRSKVLENNQTFIEYFTGEDNIYALTIDQKKASLSRIKSDDYNKKATELVTLCANRSKLNQNYSRYRQLANDLYETLFKPLSIQTKRVIISPDDHFIPFDILLTDRDNPTSFLLQDHAFSYTYSAGYLMKNKQKKAAVHPTLLGFAPVEYQSYLHQQPLLGADFSLKNIEANFSSGQSLTNKSATKREFLNRLPFHSVVHLYSHAEADNLGNEPTIYFYDSALHVSELQMLGNLTTEVIVLSACNTGIGKNIRGEGVFSMARGFAAAGIPSSITALWQIDNQSTYLLTELFYKYLGKGLPLDEALQQSKLEFLHSQDKSHDLPYYWAGSILIGKSASFLQEKKSLPIAFPNLIAGMLLLLLFISTVFYYKGNDFSIQRPVKRQ